MTTFQKQSNQGFTIFYILSSQEVKEVKGTFFNNLYHFFKKLLFLNIIIY